MKIYKLTAFNFKQQYILEETYFTNKAKAIESKDNLIEYLINNHSLNKDNIEHLKGDLEFIKTTMVDDTYKVTLKVIDTVKRVIKYED